MMDLVRIEFLDRSGLFRKEHISKYVGFSALLLARFRKQLKLGDKFHIIYQIIGHTDDAVFIDVKFVKNGYIHCHAIEKQMIYEHNKGLVEISHLFELIGQPKPELMHPDYIEKLIELDAHLKDADQRFHEKHAKKHE